MSLKKSSTPPAQKLSLCRFYMQDKCTRGAECAFAHGEDELREREWPHFEPCPRFSSSEVQRAWALRVLKTAAPFTTKDLQTLYRHARGLSNVLKTEGGLKRFCIAAPGELLYDDGKSLVSCAPSMTCEDAAALLRASVEQRGGHAELEDVYQENPDLREALYKHGGVAAVCDSAPWLSPKLAVTKGGTIRAIWEAAPLPCLAVGPCAERVLATVRAAVEEFGAVGTEVYVIGSAANGFASLGSDVDVMLKVPACHLQRYSDVRGFLRAFQKQLPRLRQGG